MLVKEFRIILPMTVAEYQVGQLYSVAEVSKNETGGGEGVEVLKNEPYLSKDSPNGSMNDGQYTKKIYHLDKKVGKFIRKIAPKGSLELEEVAWNAYPHCRTEVSNPKYMKDKFKAVIETVHKNDRGESENAVNLPPELLAKRQIIYIDIAKTENAAYKAEEDPKTFKSKKTGRGPLTGDWMKSVEPVMCCYKVVTIDFQWMGLTTIVEKQLYNFYSGLFLKFHIQVFCWIDDWIEMSMEDIRALEDKTKTILDEERTTGTIKGTVEK